MDYCLTKSDGGFSPPIDDLHTAIDEAMSGLMSSPGHRRNILTPLHKKVNIGMAWDGFNFKAYQHFEGDYIEYYQLPTIENGTLSMSGELRNGAEFNRDIGLGIQIYYDQPPHPLTRGQLSRTYCYDSGLEVASLRKPLSLLAFYTDDEYTYSYEPCPDPYDVPADALAPRSHDEAHAFWEAAYDASRNGAEAWVTAPWITAYDWIIVIPMWDDADATQPNGGVFDVAADIESVIALHGAGVYTVTLWAVIDGEDAVVSEYSIFHGVTPPDTYSLSR